MFQMFCVQVKGISYQLLDAQNALSFLAKDGCTQLKDTRQELIVNMEVTAMDYVSKESHGVFILLIHIFCFITLVRGRDQ